MTSISIVVPALNEERHIAGCLASLQTATRGYGEVELIVVDNGSTDGTVGIARGCGAHVLSLPGVRISALRNAGARRANGSLLAFVDADCVVGEAWMAAAQACLRRTGASVVGSFHRHPPGAGWLADAAARIVAGKHGATGYIPSGNMIVTRRCFEDAGGFDETIETNEDVDFCARARRLGHCVVADQAIDAVHLGVPTTVAEFFRREMWHGRSAFRVFWADVTHVTNLRVILFSLYFAALLIAGAGAVVASVVQRSALPLIVPLAGLVAIAGWIAWRIGLHRRAWAAEVAYNVLYGLARGAALLQIGLAWLTASLTRWKTPHAEARR